MKSITKVKLTVITLTALIIGSYFGINYIKDLFEPKKDLVTQLEKPYLIEELQYESSFVIPDIYDTSDFNELLDYQPTAALFNIQAVADSITQEAIKSFTLPIERPLPLLAHWNAGDIGFNEGMTPEYIMTLIENGNHVLPSWRINWNQPLPIEYYEASILRAKDLNLPLTFIIDPFESTFIDDLSYATMPALENPNVIDKDSNILNKISPFANNALWSEIAQKHATDSLLTQIQNLYPNPPLVMFVDNKNTSKLSWNEVNTSQRYVARYGNNQTDNFKRTLLGAQWIEKYRLLHEGFKENLISDAWKTNTKFVSYNSLSLDIGNTNEWESNSTYTNLYFSVWPQTSDANNLKYHIDGSIDSLNKAIFYANNVPFIRQEAYKNNLDYSLQLSISDSNSFYTNEQYRGFSQLALWLTRPSIIRELNSETNDKNVTMSHYQTVIDSVELIHNNATLQKFWKDGKLVENNNTKVVKSTDLPSTYVNNTNRWFLLDVDTNPSGPWVESTEIPVYAIALETGTTPNREWLVYAQSKNSNLDNIIVTIPNYMNVPVKSSIQGAFFSIKENNDPVGINMSKLTQEQIEKIQFANMQALSNPDALAPISYTQYGPFVKTVRTDSTLIVPNKDKLSWDILQIYAKQYGGPNEIVIIDTATNEIKNVKQDDKYMNWHLASNIIAPNGKLYINTMIRPDAQQTISVYDPETNELAIEAIKLPDKMSGESHPMTLGTDGNIYIAGNAFGTGKTQLAMLDPNTHIVTDFGPVGPSHSPNGVWGYHVCSDDRYTYVSSGKVPWYLVSYDRINKTHSVLAESDTLTLYQHQYGCSAKIDGISHWIDNNKLIIAPEAPWTIPADVVYADSIKTTPEKALLPPLPEISFSKVEVDNNGNAELFVKKDNIWKSYPYNVLTYEENVNRVHVLPNGNVLGTGANYSGNFIFNPTTGTSNYLGKIHLSHYTTITYNDKIYLSGYAGSRLFEYDYKSEWTHGKPTNPDEIVIQENDPNLNPRYVGDLNVYSGVHKMYTSAIGADGLIYFGGRWMRDGSGGGIAWYNPADDSQGGMYEIFSNYQIRYMTSLKNGKYIAISTYPVYDGVLGKPTPSEGRIFIFDTELKQIVRTIDPVPEAKGTGLIIATDNTHIFGITSTGTSTTGYKTYTYYINVETGELIYKMLLPMNSFIYPTSTSTGGVERFVLGPNGFLWGIIQSRMLVKIEPSTGIITPIGRVPGNTASVFFAGDKLFSPNLAKIFQLHY